jgi:hypothetical protein
VENPFVCVGWAVFWRRLETLALISEFWGAALEFIFDLSPSGVVIKVNGDAIIRVRKRRHDIAC